tara:strand:+ start:282 stop:665 length:384 start_codon:yes stop_codon:yes gene_type:complete
MNNTKEKIFVNGLKVFKPQVEWVKASISFNKDQFYIWYTEKMNDETLWTKVKRTDYKTGEDMLDKNGKQIFDDYMNIQIQENKKGELYASVNTWKPLITPESEKPSEPENDSEIKTLGQSISDDIPF